MDKYTPYTIITIVLIIIWVLLTNYKVNRINKIEHFDVNDTDVYSLSKVYNTGNLSLDNITVQNNITCHNLNSDNITSTNATLSGNINGDKLGISSDTKIKDAIITNINSKNTKFNNPFIINNLNAGTLSSSSPTNGFTITTSDGKWKRVLTPKSRLEQYLKKPDGTYLLKWKILLEDNNTDQNDGIIYRPISCENWRFDNGWFTGSDALQVREGDCIG